MYKGEVDFTQEEKIKNLVELTGIFPMSEVVSEEILERLRDIPNGPCRPISEYYDSSTPVWFIPREVKRNTR